MYSEGGGHDELVYLMKGFDIDASEIQLPILTQQQINDLLNRQKDVQPWGVEPGVPYQSKAGEVFQADHPFDFICLTRSPPYTPAAADGLFDVILERFIEPLIN